MVDPIHPITPGPSSPGRIERRPPVERPERVSRERDHPSRDLPDRRRREGAPEPDPGREEDDGGHPHVDVRV